MVLSHCLHLLMVMATGNCVNSDYRYEDGAMTNTLLHFSFHFLLFSSALLWM